MMRRELGWLSGVLVGVLAVVLAGGRWCQAAKPNDKQIRQLARSYGMAALEGPLPQPTKKVELGQALFFDQLLSGNRDTSCATCHHPQLVTGDGLALPVGTGPVTPGTLGFSRQVGPNRDFIPRNAPEVFNRGDSRWTSMFWDSRVEANGNGGFISPAGSDLPPGLENVLAVQAMFPVTSRDEMRGSVADGQDVNQNNELARIADSDLPAMWAALMQRIMAVPAYRTLFIEAYGLADGDLDGLGFEFAANAIAAFEATAFAFADSPWDAYLRGDSQALTAPQKDGALLFLTKARCAHCHNGTLLTDQRHYNLAVPQLGPGKDPEAPEDFGRFRETLRGKDRYRFRTPPLRNVAATAPYFHTGAYKTLRDAITHHTDPKAGLYGYNPSEHLDQPELWTTVLTDPAILKDIARGADLRKIRLSNQEIDRIAAFLESLTASQLEQRLPLTIPATVPSGIPVEVLP